MHAGRGIPASMLCPTPIGLVGTADPKDSDSINGQSNQGPAPHGQNHKTLSVRMVSQRCSKAPCDREQDSRLPAKTQGMGVKQDPARQKPVSALANPENAPQELMI